MHIRWLLAALATMAAAPLSAQPRGLEGWDVIGEQSVADTTQMDTLVTGGGRTYSQVRLCAFHKPVRLFGGSLRFADGSDQALPVDRIIPRSGCLEPVTLVGGGQKLSSIQMDYWAEFFGPMNADVRIYAR